MPAYPLCRGYGHELVAPYNDMIRSVAITEGAPVDIASWPSTAICR